MSSQKLLLDLTLRYPVRVFFNILFGFSSALFNGISTALIVPVLMSFLGRKAILKIGPSVIQKLLSPFETVPENYKLFAMAGVVILIIILKNIAIYASNLAANALSRTLTSDLQEEGLKLLLEVDLDFFSRAKAGDLMNRLGREMNRATTAISTSISLVITGITILVFVGLLLAISW